MKALTAELEITLETALLLTDDGTPLRPLAERIFQSERDSIEPFMQEWAVDRLVWLLQRRRAHLRPGNQLRLPGFEKLPSRLSVNGNRRVNLRYATIFHLREYRAVLERRRDSRLFQLDSLIAFMQPYSDSNRGITVERAEKMELDRRELRG